MRLHDHRHGAASLLVGAGVHPRIAQELLRHASSKTTMEIYSHVSAAQQREAVEVLQQAIAAESHDESHATVDSNGDEGVGLARLSVRVAPAVGFEPTTKRLTAARSTTELRRKRVEIALATEDGDAGDDSARLRTRSKDPTSQQLRGRRGASDARTGGRSADRRSIRLENSCIDRTRTHESVQNRADRLQLVHHRQAARGSAPPSDPSRYSR